MLLKLPPKYGQGKSNSWMISKMKIGSIQGSSQRGKKRTVYPFKRKLTLSEQKTVNITKNGQILKTIQEENLNILMERIG